MAGSWKEVGGGERSPPVNERGATPLFRVGECPSPRSSGPCLKEKKLGAGRISIPLDKGLENDIKKVKFYKDLEIFIICPLSARCFPARK